MTGQHTAREQELEILGARSGKTWKDLGLTRCLLVFPEKS
jgi:hypothetical protein